MRLLASFAAALLLVLAQTSALNAQSQQLNGPCNDSEQPPTGNPDNGFAYRQANTGGTGPWITSVSGSINRNVYTLCDQSNGIVPNLTASGAWVAIEGPGSSDIVQDGYWECGNGLVCGNGMDTYKLDFFYAWGNSTDPTKMPWPTWMGLADSASSHTFTTDLNAQTGVWEFKIDGVIRATQADGSWRNWNRTRIQAASENWNCGDELGGRTVLGSDPGNHQKFRTVKWVAGGVTHNGGLGSVVIYSPIYGNTGNGTGVWPWYYASSSGTDDLDAWTYNHTTGSCQG